MARCKGEGRRVRKRRRGERIVKDCAGEEGEEVGRREGVEVGTRGGEEGERQTLASSALSGGAAEHLVGLGELLIDCGEAG